MKRILISLTLLTLALAVIATGSAAVMFYSPSDLEPSAWLQVGNEPLRVLSGWVPYEDSWFLNFTEQTSQWTVSGNVSTQGDPFVSYGVAFNNNSGGDLTFSLGIFDPMGGIASPTTVYASYSGSGTDVGGDGFSILPIYPDLDGDGIAEIQTTILDGTISAGVDVGQGHVFGPGFPGHSNDLGTYSSGPMAGPAGGPWNSLGVNIGLALSGEDIATVNGYSSIATNPVPEPASLLLMGLGLTATAFVARRRQRRTA